MKWFGKALLLAVIAGSCFGWAWAVVQNLKQDPGSLDSAQRSFEEDFKGSRGYNWPWFHQHKFGLILACRDTGESLRVCTVSMPTLSPDGTLESLHHDPFACSRFKCAWVVEP